MKHFTYGLAGYFKWADRDATRQRRKHRFLWLYGSLLWVLAGCATQPATRMHVVMTGNPPQYFSGIVTYRNNHVQRLMVGSDRFLSCQLALADTGPALAKAIETDGWAAKGICIPVPTLDVSDLIPRELF